MLKWFQNEITFISTEENNHEHSIVARSCASLNQEQRSDISISSKQETESESKMQKQLEAQLQHQQQEKCRAQILAAERSLQTNLVLVLSFCLLFFIFIFVSKQLRLYFIVVVFSIMKAAMPLMTTLANFGTVQSVANQYCNHLKQKYPKLWQK